MRDITNNNKMVRVPSFQHQDSILLYNSSDLLNEYDAQLFRDGSSIMDCSNSEPNFSQDVALSSESQPNDSIAYEEDAKKAPTREVEQRAKDKNTDQNTILKDTNRKKNMMKDCSTKVDKTE